ncbi:MAG: type II TA system antitoxin MqsA family protein [Sphingomicrobium sp.]
MADETRIHPETGDTLRRGVRTMTIAYAIYTREIVVPGWYPDGDGDAIHSGADLAEWNAAFLQMRADYARRIRSVRNRLGFTQAEAGRVLGGGKRAFQKYESGKTPPSDAAIALIELIDRHPEEIELLKKLPGRQLAAA